jgi:hypothetical protein
MFLANVGRRRSASENVSWVTVAMLHTSLLLSPLFYHSEQVTVAWQPQNRSGSYDKRNCNIKTCMTEVHLADVRQEDGCFIIVILIGTDRRFPGPYYPPQTLTWESI